MLSIRVASRDMYKQILHEPSAPAWSVDLFSPFVISFGRAALTIKAIPSILSLDLEIEGNWVRRYICVDYDDTWSLCMCLHNCDCGSGVKTSDRHLTACHLEYRRSIRQGNLE